MINEIPEEQLKDALFMMGTDWGDTLSAKHIDDIVALFKTLNWKVMTESSVASPEGDK